MGTGIEGYATWHFSDQNHLVSSSLCKTITSIFNIRVIRATV